MLILNSMCRFLFILLCLVVDWLYYEPSTTLHLCNPGLLLGLIGTGLGLAGNVANGLMAAHAQSEANETNKQLVRETNEQNKKLFYDQLGWTEEMWNRNNAYNAPVEQRRRLEEAGFNPYMALQAVQGSQATAATSPALPQMQSPQVAPVNYGQAISDVFPNLMSNLSQIQQYESIGLDNKMKAVDASVRIQEKALELMDRAETIRNKKWISEKSRKELKMLDQNIRKLLTENNYLQNYLHARNNQAKEEANIAHYNALKAQAEADYQRQLTDAFPKMNKAQLDLLASQMADAYASAGAHRAAAGMYGAQAAHGWEQAKTEYNLRPYRVLVEKFNGLLAQGASKLQDLGIPAAELKAMRDKDIIRQRKDGNFRFTDNAVYWFADKFATIFSSAKK